MSKQVNIAGEIFDLPVQSQNPPWGSELSAILEALIDIANTVLGPADISTTNFSVVNNVSVASNVIGLSFDNSTVRSAIVSYSLYRTSSISEASEVGQLMLTRKSTAGTWEMAQYGAGTSGVVFSVLSSGQIAYTSSNFSGTSYSGKMVFSAKSFLQT